MDAAGLFERHYRLIVAYLARRVYAHDQSIVEDLAQEVFIKAHRYADRYEDRGLSETRWLFRIAHNVMVDHYRKRPPDVPLDFVADGVKERPASVQPEPVIDFGPLLARLTPDQRDVIDLRWLQGYSTRETSVAIGKSEDAVKKLQARALVKLRHMIEMDRICRDAA